MEKIKRGDRVEVIGPMYTGSTGVVDSFWMPEFVSDNRIIEVRLENGTYVTFGFDELVVIR